MLEPQHAAIDDPAPRRRPERSDNVIAGAVIILVIGLWGLPWLSRGLVTKFTGPIVSHEPVEPAVAPPAPQPEDGATEERNSGAALSERADINANRKGRKTNYASTKEDAASASAGEAAPSSSVASTTRLSPPSSKARQRELSHRQQGAEPRRDERMDEGDGSEPPTPSRQEQTIRTRLPGTSYVTPEGRTVIVAPPP